MSILGRRPRIPGHILREKIAGMSAERRGKLQRLFATRMVERFISEKERITPEWAADFERLIGIPVAYWLDVQAEIDEWDAAKKALDSGE